MPEPLNVTGRWFGHYLQHDVKHLLTADLVQDGVRLTGTMRDHETEFDRSVFDAMADAGLPPGADEQIIAQLRQAVPGAANRPVRYVSHLPPESTLEGLLQGQTVYWLKTYQGTEFGGYRVGDEHVGVEVTNPQVHYRGEVSADGTVIEGTWWIDANPRYGTVRTQGQFSLRRRPGESVAADAAVTARAASGAGHS
jgi:hypothetical protein